MRRYGGGHSGTPVARAAYAVMMHSAPSTASTVHVDASRLRGVCRRKTTMNPDTLLSNGETVTEHAWKRRVTASCIALVHSPQSYSTQRESSVGEQRPPRVAVHATVFTKAATSAADMYARCAAAKRYIGDTAQRPR
jgi:hypothetical protein